LAVILLIPVFAFSIIKTIISLNTQAPQLCEACH
jgi:hypothetical protein